MSLGRAIEWISMLVVIVAAFIRLVIVLLYLTSLAFFGVWIVIKAVSWLNIEITCFYKAHVDRKLHPQVPFSINGVINHDL